MSDYREALKGWADAIMFHGKTVAEQVGTVLLFDNNNKQTPTEPEMIATEETLTMLIIWVLTQQSTELLLQICLNNHFVKGKDEYPKDMATAETVLELYKTPANQSLNQRP